MARLHSHRQRPVHLGPLPAERLPRLDGAPELPARQPDDGTTTTTTTDRAVAAVAAVVPEYLALCAGHLTGAVAAVPAPVPDDLQARADNLKATACFLDATLAGICALAPGDLTDGDGPCGSHTHALVFLVEFSRDAHADEPGAAWTAGSHTARTDLRCAEVAVVLAGYLRALGWPAQGHLCRATARSTCASWPSAPGSPSRWTACWPCPSPVAASGWAW